jgi:PAS domain S-box-containing protein
MQNPFLTAVLSLKNDNEIVGISPGLEELLGWTAADLIGQSVDRILSASDLAGPMPLPDGETSERLQGMRRDGQVLDLEAKCRRWRTGQNDFTTLFLRPLDRVGENMVRAEAIDRARDLEERWAALLDASPDAILITDEAGRIEAFNASAERLFGWKEEEILGRNIVTILPAALEEETAGGETHPFGAPTEAGSTDATEMLAVTAGGDTLPVELSVGRAAGPAGRSYIAIIRDITRRQQAAADLAHSESNLRMAQALAHLGSFELTYPGDGIMYWSEEVFRVLGLDPAKGVPALRTLRDAILHPDDRNKVVSSVLAASRHGGVLKLNYRIRRPDGTVRHVQTAARMHVAGPSDSWRVSGTVLDVTERRWTEEALRTERDRAELYLDLVGVIVVAVDTRGNITMINRQGLDTLAVEEDEALGRNFFQLFIPEEFRKSVLESFRELIHSTGEAALRIDEGWIETRSGKRRFIRWRNKKMLDSSGKTVGVLGAGEDISDQRRIQDQLRQAEEELRLTFKHAPIGMATLDLEGHILSVNQSLCNMLGYRDSELLGLAMKEIIHQDDRAVAIRLLRQLLTGEIEYVRHEKRYFRRDGSVMHGIVRYSLIHDPRGRPLMFVAQIVDRTEQIEAELEIRQHRERMAQVSRLGTMGEMAAGIAHELNQPLTAISNYVQACQRLVQNQAIEKHELQQILGKVGEQARRAGMVIQGLRRFVKRRSIVREATNINQVLRDVMMLAELDCRANQIPITAEADEELPRVQGDPVQLQQVLLNLIRNAVDSMIEIDNKEAGISLLAAISGSDEIAISVTDHGAGVREKDAARVFDPFFTTKEDGMGLGLALSRSIAEAHGGRLVFTDNPAGGTIFSLILPTLPEEE